jgi:hypothetical protein
MNWQPFQPMASQHPKAARWPKRFLRCYCGFSAYRVSYLLPYRHQQSWQSAGLVAAVAEL